MLIYSGLAHEVETQVETLIIIYAMIINNKK